MVTLTMSRTLIAEAMGKSFARWTWRIIAWESQHLVAAAQNLRRNEIADRNDEGDERADGNARYAEGKRNAKEDLKLAGAQILARKAVGFVDLDEVGVDRERQQHHEEVDEPSTVAPRV